MLGYVLCIVSAANAGFAAHNFASGRPNLGALTLAIAVLCGLRGLVRSIGSGSL